jgi:peptide/nickel transport system substrate-binding protein
LILALVIVAGCAPGTPSSAPPRQDGAQPAENRAQPAPNTPSRTLVFLTHVEPPILTEHRAVTGTGSVPSDAIRLFNASLFLADARGVPQPYLLERAPELNTDTWKVFPDGRMETIYTLRPNLVWHDGTPFTAEDMVLSWRIAKTPEFGVAELLPARIMEEVVAVDARTILVRWNRTWPDVNNITGRAWAPTPRHILQSAFESQPAAQFASHPYWTRDYVGLGPFKMDRREPGAFIEGSAFDQHALGRPKVDRIQVRYVGDPNTAVANLLSGDAHIAFDFTLSFDHGALLKREWTARNGGSVLLAPDKLRYVQTQFKTDYTRPVEILDVRVRRALAHAIDRRSLLDGLLDGQGEEAIGMAAPGVEYYAEVDRTVTKLPYDLRQTERLLNEAGLTRGSDGYYAGASRFSPELRGTSVGQEERENAILADSWRRAGIDVQTRLLSEVEDSDRELRATFPSFAAANTGLDEPTLYLKLYSANSATAANRWAGSNRTGWLSRDYDRAYDVLTSSLVRTERNQAAVQMAKLVGEEVPIFPLYFNYLVQAHVAGLKGPQAYAPGGQATWGIHEWEFR